VVTAETLADWFEEAIQTDRKLPPAYRKGYSAMRFEIKHDVTEHGAAVTRRPKIAASSKQIARYEFLLFHVTPMLSVEERKLVWLRGLRVPYVRIGRRMGMHRHTVKKKYIETLVYIKLLIALDKKLFAKVDKIK
jgi:hypothetical protein